MAIDDSVLAQIKLAQAAALKVCRDQLPQQLAVFKEVNNSLGLWAGETVINESVRNDMTTLINGIDSMINSTRQVCGEIGDFVYEQEHSDNISGEVHTYDF